MNTTTAVVVETTNPSNVLYLNTTTHHADGDDSSECHAKSLKRKAFDEINLDFEGESWDLDSAMDPLDAITLDLEDELTNLDYYTHSMSMPDLISPFRPQKRRRVTNTARNHHEMVLKTFDGPTWESLGSFDRIVTCMLSFMDVSDVVRFKGVDQKWKELCVDVIKHNFKPKKTFKTKDKLCWAVKKYFKNNKKAMDFFGRTYGYPIGKWNVSRITDFSYLFEGHADFNEEIVGWNISNATTLKGMFKNATSFNQRLEDWDTSSVKNMSSMFCGALSFDQPLSSWDVSSVKFMNRTFQNAKNFNQFLRHWETDKLKKMDDLFLGADAFDEKKNWNASITVTKKKSKKKKP